MPQIIYPGRFIKLAELYSEAKQQAGNNHYFYRLIDKQEAHDKINH
jgi:hypothetical protein